MEEKKYELTNETIECCGRILHRIKALRDFNDVKVGDLGGFIEKEDNLSHDGNCWIYDYALVFGDAYIYDDALVFDYAHVYDNARVYNNAEVFGNARVSGNAYIFNNACVSDNARVLGNACIYGYAEIYGDMHVYSGLHDCTNKNYTKERKEAKTMKKESTDNVNKNINNLDMFKNHDYVKIIYQILVDDVWQDGEFAAAKSIHSAILYAVESMYSEITDIHRNNTDIIIYFGDTERYVLTPMNFV